MCSFDLTLAVLLGIVLAVSAIVTRIVLAYSVRRSVIDIPNERSSHSVPTPSGGGLGIAMTVIAFCYYLWLIDVVSAGLILSIGIGGAMVALLGWSDDHKSLPAFWRILIQIGVAIFVVNRLGGVQMLQVGQWQFSLGIMGSIAAVVGMVWLINLYNFMDGTDGIAGTQALLASAMAGFLFFSSCQSGLGMIALSVAAASLGFLLWNWPPAKIFMGDTGSYFLGLVLGVLILAGEKSGAVPLLVWVILLAVFIWDATLTLIQRMLKGERWYAAHRDHAYQQLVRTGFSHRRVAVGMLALNVLVLWPLAWLGHREPALLPWLTLASALLVSGLWVGVRARYRHNTRITEQE